MDKKVIIARIEELMLEKGISKYQLKENAEISSTIYQWKKNAKRDATRTPSLKSLEKICNYFGVSLSYFFAFTDKEKCSSKILEIKDALNVLNLEQLIIVQSIVDEFNNCRR